MRERSELMEAIRRGILDGDGHLPAAVRRAVFAGAQAGAGAEPSGVLDLDSPMREFVAKVAGPSYKVTDADFHALAGAGYDQDAIFEATIAAAVGAGFARLAAGRRALGLEV